MKKILFLIALFMPIMLMAETWNFPMGGLTQNSKITITDNAMSINWDDFNGNHIDFTFKKGKSGYKKGLGDWTYNFFSAEHGSNGSILFKYADADAIDSDMGILLILDVADKSSNPLGKELMKVGVDAGIFNTCFKRAISKGIFYNLDEY